MSNISIFNTIWEKTEKIVLSHIRESLKDNVSSNEDFTRIYQYATKNFNYGNLIERQWLSELQSQKPEKASQFIEHLTTFKFQEVRFRQLYKHIGYFLVLVIGIITSTVLFNITTDLSAFKVVLWGILSMIISSGILLPLFLARQEKHMEKVLDKYRHQLDNLKETLIKIIS